VLLPDNLLALTLAALLPIVLMYWLLERLFAQTELLGPVRVVSPWSADA
jgi:ABC-type glycerol-3-phosphate transport system permease component